eukprot:scaffold7295_cov167-Amphora_coffeaeformis.AAC.4
MVRWNGNIRLYPSTARSLTFAVWYGSAAVHLIGGAAAMTGAWVLGPRIGRFVKNEETGKIEPAEIPGHIAVLAALGTLLFWFGLFSFHADAGYSVAGNEALAVTGHSDHRLSGRCGCLYSSLLLRNGVWDPAFGMNGLICNMVATCSGSGSLNTFCTLTILSMLLPCTCAMELSAWSLSGSLPTTSTSKPRIKLVSFMDTLASSSAAKSTERSPTLLGLLAFPLCYLEHYAPWIVSAFPVKSSSWAWVSFYWRQKPDSAREHHHAGAAFRTKSMKAGEGKALDDSSASSHKEPMEEIFPKVDNDKCEELRHRKITTALKPGQV